MAKAQQDRRSADRRGTDRGGRRSTDPPATQATPVSCPSCGGTNTTEAGSAAGGWWFVCGGCDHLWDERARRAESV
jgi:hypothetical protein